MAKHTLQLLGPVQVTWQTGEPPRFRSQRTMALLGYLAAERRPVARDKLAALFWPDESLVVGRSNLRRELHNLSNILPGCWQVDRSLAAFIPSSETAVDLDLLRNLEVQERWLQAAAYASGEFLEGLYLANNPEFETWLLGERERWLQRAERVLTQAARSEQRQGNYAQARRDITHLLRLVPWHEDGHRQMMRLLAYSGELSAALRQYERCRAILADELDTPPSLSTTTLYERIKAAMALPPHNLPSQATPFIDRAAEAEVLINRLVDPGCRLLTLIGVGGIGKSRLALEIARRMEAEDFRPFLHGIAFVPLAGVDRQDILGAIGVSLGITFSGQQPPEHQLLTYLRDMELLLLLDNYEHLLPETTLLAAILREAPAVKVLVTSRERLRLREEWLFEVDGLPYPQEEHLNVVEEDVIQHAALLLFLTSAQRVRRTISMADSGMEVASICRLVQGMPLALELAAAQLWNLTPGEVVEGLERGLDILSAEARNASARHASLRAAFDISWVGLSTQEQKVLSRLSLFRGGFTRDAAFAVAGAALPVLDRLSSKSLIRLMPAGRYEMHELLRQYAAEKLAEDSGSGADARDQYIRYYGLFLQQRDERLTNTDQSNTLGEIVPEIDNIRQAWRWAVERRQLPFLDQSIWTVAFFYDLRGRFPEALDLIESTLKDLPWLTLADLLHLKLWTRLKLFKSFFLFRIGRSIESQAILEEISPQLHDLGDERDLAWAAFVLGEVLANLDDVQGAVITLERGVPFCKRAGLAWLEVILVARAAFYNATSSAGEGRGMVKARHLEEHALAISRPLDNPWMQTGVNISCSRLAVFRGEYIASELLDQAALAAARRIDDLWGIGVSLFYVGLDKYLQEDAEASWQYYEESRQVLHRTGDKHLEAVLASAMGELARFQEDFDQACRLYHEGIEICIEYSYTNLIATVYCMYGYALFGQSNWQQAWSYFHQSLSMPGSRTGPTGDMTGLNLLGCALVLDYLGKPAAAVQLMGAAEAQFEAASRQLWPADRRVWERVVAEMQERLDGNAFTAGWETGRGLSLDQAIHLAMDRFEQA